MEAQTVETPEKRRERLLAMNEGQAKALGWPIWYERLRYMREMEATEFVRYMQQGMVRDKAKEACKLYRN